jgi:hypothetical protein
MWICLSVVYQQVWGVGWHGSDVMVLSCELLQQECYSDLPAAEFQELDMQCYSRYVVLF